MSLLSQLIVCLVLQFVIPKYGTGLFLRSGPYVVPNNDDYYGDEIEDILVIVLYDDESSSKENIYLRETNIVLEPDLNIPKESMEASIPYKAKKSLHYSEEEKHSNDFAGLKLTRKQKTMLRKKWRASCDKKAAKACKKACKKAAKNACRTYNCQKSLRRQFKRECKNSCKSKFLDGTETDSESD